MRACDLCFVLCATAGILSAQDLMQIDMTLGFTRHQQITSKTRLISEGEIVDKLSRVFHNLTKTPGFSGGALLTHQLSFLDQSEVNAYATGGGHIYVTRGLVEAVQGNEGILAFVMGHEMIHNRNQHGARQLLRRLDMNREYRRLYAQNGPLAAATYEIGMVVIEKKLEREEEHEADQIGLRIAAEAGYHPDYAILAARKLRAETGDAGRFSAFFSTHPRWITREERSEKNYDDAVKLFNLFWPVVEASPGGRPSAVASATKPKVKKVGRQYQMSTGVRIRNLRGIPAQLIVQIIGERNPEPFTIGERSFIEDHSTLEQLLVKIPEEILLGRKGKQYGRIVVMAGSEILYQSGLVKLE